MPPVATITTELGTSQIFDKIYVKKPKQRGTLGRPIGLITNHYPVKMKPLTLTEYDVSLARVESGGGEASNNGRKRNPDEDLKDKEVVKEIYTSFLNKLPSNYRNRIAYNLSKNLYALDKLPFNDSVK